MHRLGSDKVGLLKYKQSASVKAKQDKVQKAEVLCLLLHEPI